MVKDRNIFAEMYLVGQGQEAVEAHLHLEQCIFMDRVLASNGNLHIGLLKIVRLQGNGPALAYALEDGATPILEVLAAGAQQLIDYRKRFLKKESYNLRLNSVLSLLKPAHNACFSNAESLKL